MNKKMIFPSLFLLMSVFMSASQSAIHASDVLELVRVTPYPTLTPIGNTPTPIHLEQAVDFSCPLGAPAGYGVVTPSTDWLYACGQCLPTNTPVVFSTSTLGPTHTPVYIPPVCATPEGGGLEVCSTVTPLATSTVTSVPTFTSTPAVTATSTSSLIDCYGTLAGSSCEDFGSYLKYTVDMSYTGVGADFTVGNFKLGSSGQPVGMLYDYTLSSMAIYSFHHVTTYMRLHPFGASSFTSTHAILSSNGTSVSVSNSYDDWIPSIFYNPALPLALEVQGDLNAANTSSQVVGTFYVYTSAGFTVPTPATAVPTVTTTPFSGDGFCSSIMNTNVPNQFELGGTGSIVFQSCMSTPEISYQTLVDWLIPDWLFGLDEYFSSIFPVAAILDPLTVCIRSRDYSLYIFGYRLPIEFMFGLAVFLSAMRFFTPSVFSGASSLGFGQHGTSSSQPRTGNDDKMSASDWHKYKD